MLENTFKALKFIKGEIPADCEANFELIHGALAIRFTGYIDGEIVQQLSVISEAEICSVDAELALRYRCKSFTKTFENLKNSVYEEEK